MTINGCHTISVRIEVKASYGIFYIERRLTESAVEENLLITFVSAILRVPSGFSDEIYNIIGLRAREIVKMISYFPCNRHCAKNSSPWIIGLPSQSLKETIIMKEKFNGDFTARHFFK